MKRIRLTVRWDKGEEKWIVRCGATVITSFPFKQDAISEGRRHARHLWKAEGARVELLIYNKNGKLGKGSTSRATYGRDPQRFKG